MTPNAGFTSSTALAALRVQLLGAQALALPRAWIEAMLAGEIANTTAAIPAPRRRAVARHLGAVEVLPVRGVIQPRRTILEDWGLATSAETIGAAVRAAVADPEVKAVVLDMDSPGGVVSGVPELAATLRALRGTTPIIAHADHLAASAAYWIAAQADEVVASPSALVGSIGVFSLHLDFSEMLKTEGVKATFIASTPEKVDGNMFEPLSESGESELRAIVDDAYRMFVNGVAEGRGVSAATVRDDFGHGHVLTASAAKRAGLIDDVRTLDETLAGLGIGAAPLEPASRGGRRARAAARRAREIELLDTRAGLGAASGGPDRP